MLTRCPQCNRRVGRIAKNAYYSLYCERELKVKEDGIEFYTINSDGVNILVNKMQRLTS